jgi:hypothetical protein
VTTINSNNLAAELLARARDEVGRENPKTWIFREDGPEIAGILVDKGTYDHEDEAIPTRTLYRDDHGDYVKYFLWSSPQKLVELDVKLNPQIGDFVYVKVEPKRPKRDKPGESWIPCSMKVIPKAEIEAMGTSDDGEEVDDYGTPIRY